MSRPHSIILLALALLLTAHSADAAALTTGTCLAMKRNAWGNLRKCQAAQESNLLKGKTADLAKCQTSFQDKIAKISAKATDGAVACRYADNGDGTVTDYDTGLQWEKKNGFGGGENLANAHDVDNIYSWNGDNPTGSTPSGTAFTDFLGRLNTCTAGGGLQFQLTGFAGHCDWRLPSLTELQSILLAPQPCPTTPCINLIFGPTGSASYWSATSEVDHPTSAWSEYFGNAGGGTGTGSKNILLRVRAVRRSF